MNKVDLEKDAATEPFLHVSPWRGSHITCNNY